MRASRGLIRTPTGSWPAPKMAEHRVQSRRLSGVELFREEQRVFAEGDRIQFRAPDWALASSTGNLRRSQQLTTPKPCSGWTMGARSLRVRRLRHIDYGYASTSHSSQGATVDRVIVNVDTARSAELVNRKQFYVSISPRARHAVSLYTDDRARLDLAVGRNREKSLALKHVRPIIQRRDQNYSRTRPPEPPPSPWNAKMRTGLEQACSLRGIQSRDRQAHLWLFAARSYLGQRRTAGRRAVKRPDCASQNFAPTQPRSPTLFPSLSICS